ncbi:MAG: DUF4037 domain-containing protein [Thermomicrobiales bacterium]|nr:DUF4037 domain-containing protein [Thermomicrobiales bacterium]
MRSHDLIERLTSLPQVQAIAVGGSQASGMASGGSDTDLYVLVSERVDPAIRRGIARELADDPEHAEIANPWWGDEDGYAVHGVWYDIVFFDLRWFQDEIERVTIRHEAREGYSTCFVHTLENLRILFDRDGQLQLMQDSVPSYPDTLAQRIIANNLAVAGRIHSSYRNQIARAIELRDPVSLNHRVAAFLACVFDIAFAHLHMWHPGEKRQLIYLRQWEDKLPTGLIYAIERVVVRGDDVMLAVDQVVAGLAEMAASS